MPLPFFVKGGALALLAATGGAAGDTTIRTVDEPVHRGVATLVEELSIGVADGEEHDMLGEIADIALAPDGSLFALDRQVPVIRHYDAMGRFLGNVGRSGQGPGEYRIVSGIAVDREGRLVVWDTGNWRVSIYAPNGDFLSQWHTSSGTGGSATANYSRGLVVDRDGRVVTRRTLFSRDLSDRPTVWIRYGPDGAVLDTLRAPDFPVPAAQLTAVAGGARASTRVPFTPWRIVTYSPLGQFVAGYPSRYAFEVHRPGDVLSVRRSVRPEPVSRDERSSERQRVEEQMRRTQPNWSWNGPDIPATKPFYQGIEVGLDGRVWIAIEPETSPRVGNMSSGVGMGRQRPVAPVGGRDEAPGPALYDVFEPDGHYLGRVRVPAKVSTVVRRGDLVWAVAFDDDDVPRIKRFRIAWGR